MNDFNNLFMLKEAFESCKLAGEIPQDMTLEQYLVEQLKQDAS